MNTRIKFINSYSFDDILILPQKSDVKSRKDIDLSTVLTKDGSIRLHTPIIASPMDTVCTDKMAIAMAMLGGLGIIHRFQSIEDQVEMVKAVKRHLSYVIHNPYTIQQDSTLEDLLRLMHETHVSGILVVDDSRKLVGIVSKKDLDLDNLCGSSGSRQVVDVMTPFEKMHCLYEYDYDTVLNTFRKHNVEKLPIVDKERNIKGLVVFKNLMYFHHMKDVASLDQDGRLCVGAAVGISHDWKERAARLVEAGVDIINVDVANGHNTIVADAVRELKQRYPSLPIMAGNVCTAEGYEFLCEAGADCIRVGIGNGSICSTRLETGIGNCQFSALYDCSNSAKKYNVPMISDGGHCGKTGNKFKALAAGASCVLLGRSLAGTSESPGEVFFRNGRRVKAYRGMASALANVSKQQKIHGKVNLDQVTVEGVDGVVEFKGSVKNIVQQICNGMRSGMSYLGCHSLQELHNTQLQFAVITSSGNHETKTRV
jgi:IMP dehydrogenase